MLSTTRKEHVLAIIRQHLMARWIRTIADSSTSCANGKICTDMLSEGMWTLTRKGWHRRMPLPIRRSPGNALSMKMLKPTRKDWNRPADRLPAVKPLDPYTGREASIAPTKPSQLPFAYMTVGGRNSNVFRSNAKLQTRDPSPSASTTH